MLCEITKPSQNVEYVRKHAVGEHARPRVKKHAFFSSSFDLRKIFIEEHSVDL